MPPDLCDHPGVGGRQFCTECATQQPAAGGQAAGGQAAGGQVAGGQAAGRQAGRRRAGRRQAGHRRAGRAASASSVAAPMDTEADTGADQLPHPSSVAASVPGAPVASSVQHGADSPHDPAEPSQAVRSLGKRKRRASQRAKDTAEHALEDASRRDPRLTLVSSRLDTAGQEVFSLLARRQCRKASFNIPSKLGCAAVLVHWVEKYLKKKHNNELKVSQSKPRLCVCLSCPCRMFVAAHSHTTPSIQC